MTWTTIELHHLPSPANVAAWRRRTARALRDATGLRFAKAMTTLGTAASGGFAAGRPALARQLLLTCWDERPAAWAGGVPYGAALLRPRATRGTFRGERPFAAAAAEDEATGTGFAALTLGRSTLTALPRFVRHGTGLAGHVAGAPGLRLACTAGFPPTGNATFSVWDAEADMVRFAYGAQVGGHRATVTAHRRRAILAEQVSARFAVIALDGAWARR